MNTLIPEAKLYRDVLTECNKKKNIGRKPQIFLFFKVFSFSVSHIFKILVMSAVRAIFGRFLTGMTHK